MRCVPTTEVLLDCKGLRKTFGKLEVLKGVSFSVGHHEIFGIAGPNGAGKSVLFNVITKIPYPPDEGEVQLDQVMLTGLGAPRIAQSGISRTWQTPTVFPTLTTIKNVKVGAYFGQSKSPSDGEAVDLALKSLEIVGLSEKKDVLAANLNLMDKKLLMIASALATRPKVLLLDEPFGGLNPAEINQTISIIKELNRSGMTLLVIEHMMDLLVGLSNRLIILSAGQKIAEGDPNEVVANKTVREVYIG